MPNDHQIAELARLIDRARQAVVFTGAGISTESGIPDFRSPGGIWTRMAPIDFSDFLASEEARRETWRRRFAMEETFRAAAPNRGHRAVAELVRRGKVAAVITQNIDGLHQAAGIADDRVIGDPGGLVQTVYVLRDYRRHLAAADQLGDGAMTAVRRRCSKCLFHREAAPPGFAPGFFRSEKIGEIDRRHAG